jgi:hypothetical protein
MSPLSTSTPDAPSSSGAAGDAARVAVKPRFRHARRSPGRRQSDSAQARLSSAGSYIILLIEEAYASTGVHLSVQRRPARIFRAA